VAYKHDANKNAGAASMGLATASVIRQPKQRRSRQSLERVVAATAALISKRGSADFTLSDVSDRSGVSIGSIYGRFSGKDELVRVVQEHLNGQLHAEFAEFEARMHPQSLKLVRLVPAAVNELANLLRKHAPFLRAMIELSLTDTVIAAQGRRIYFDHAGRFKNVLMDCRGEIKHRNPEHAAEFCFTVVYQMVANHLGFGDRASSDEDRWGQLLDDLRVLCLRYLTAHPGS
jgi:AcrR family transcriptional regulator